VSYHQKFQFTYINAKICIMNKAVIIRDHHPCLFTARSKHHARIAQVVDLTVFFEGLWRLISSASQSTLFAVGSKRLSQSSNWNFQWWYCGYQDQKIYDVNLRDTACLTKSVKITTLRKVVYQKKIALTCEALVCGCSSRRWCWWRLHNINPASRETISTE